MEAVQVASNSAIPHAILSEEREQKPAQIEQRQECIEPLPLQSSTQQHESPQALEKQSRCLSSGEEGESEEARIERLGRERPTKFTSLGAEVAFCYSVIASQFMAVGFI